MSRHPGAEHLQAERGVSAVDTDTPHIKISKLDAARRQLRCAIELWFRDADPVSIHTLTFAAHQILSDLCFLKTGADMLCRSAIINPVYQREVIEIFNRHGNFFKHADRDPQEIVDFPPEMSEAFLVLAIGCLQALGESLTPTETAFYTWEALHRPKWLDRQHEFLMNSFPVEGVAYLNSLKRREYFEQALEAIALQTAAAFSR